MFNKWLCSDLVGRYLGRSQVRRMSLSVNSIKWRLLLIQSTEQCSTMYVLSNRNRKLQLLTCKSITIRIIRTYDKWVGSTGVRIPVQVRMCVRNWSRSVCLNHLNLQVFCLFPVWSADCSAKFVIFFGFERKPTGSHQKQKPLQKK